MKSFALLIVGLLVCAFVIPGGTIQASSRMSDQVGIDTMPPQITVTSQACGVVTFEATEIRNIPDPPTVPPKATDQVESGIASITISSAPASVNAKITYITDNTFPKNSPYYRFSFKIEAVDPSVRATAYLWVRDWKDNVTSREVIIEPTMPTSSDNSVTMTARANNTVTYTVTLRNTTTAVQTITSISINGSTKITLTQGGSATPVTIDPGATRTIVISYTPDLASETGDNATLEIKTACGDKNIPVSGTGTVGRLATTDWNAGDVWITTEACAPTFKITNNGSADVTITDIQPDPANPEVTFVLEGNTFPIVLAANGGTVDVAKLCYKPMTVGTDAANITVVSNSETGDNICAVTGNGVPNTSVSPEVLARLNVRFDATSEVVRFESMASAKLYNMNGGVIGVAGENARMVAVKGVSNGAYFLVLDEIPTVTIPVSIVR